MNPYQAPTYDASPRAHHAEDRGDSEVRDDILESMRRTKPWVKFLGIVGYVMSVLMVLGGLYLMVATPTTLKLGAGAGAIGLVYAIMGAINLFPSIHLSSYASSIQDLLELRNMATLATALEKQKKFWRFVGILMAVLLGFYGLCIAVIAIAAVSR